MITQATRIYENYNEVWFYDGNGVRVSKSEEILTEEEVKECEEISQKIMDLSSRLEDLANKR